MEVEGGWSYSDIKAFDSLYKSYDKDIVRFGFHDGLSMIVDVNKLDLTNRIHAGYVFDEIYNKLTGNGK